MDPPTEETERFIKEHCVTQTVDVTKEMEKSDNKPLGSTVASHYNQLRSAEVNERKESRIYHLRNFNNWIKSVMINEFMDKIKKQKRVSDDLNVLDLACGKGGDLLKWKMAGNVDHVIMADIADVSIEQCKERFAKLKSDQFKYRNRNSRGYNQDQLFSAEFFAADCTKTQINYLYRNQDIKFDLSSCQFAFHYSFESYEQVDMMLKNLCGNLRVGGYFIGTTPDAHKIVKNIKSCSSDSFGNSIFNIKPECKFPFPLFGSKYFFHLEGVVNCPEFVVYFPLLEKMAAKYNMKLVWKKNFHTLFFENEIKHKTLLNKMNVLERYPNGKEGAGGQYEDAQQHLLNLGGGNETNYVGTLSKDEWEVAGLYVAFAFEKIDT